MLGALTVSYARWCRVRRIPGSAAIASHSTRSTSADDRGPLIRASRGLDEPVELIALRSGGDERLHFSSGADVEAMRRVTL